MPTDDMPTDLLVMEISRLRDLQAQDTPAPDWPAAKEAAEALARRFGTRVVVLQVVGEVQGHVEAQWRRAPAGNGP